MYILCFLIFTISSALLGAYIYEYLGQIFLREEIINSQANRKKESSRDFVESKMKKLIYLMLCFGVIAFLSVSMVQFLENEGKEKMLLQIRSDIQAIKKVEKIYLVPATSEQADILNGKE